MKIFVSWFYSKPIDSASPKIRLFVFYCCLLKRVFGIWWFVHNYARIRFFTTTFAWICFSLQNWCLDACNFFSIFRRKTFYQFIHLFINFLVSKATRPVSQSINRLYVDKTTIYNVFYQHLTLNTQKRTIFKKGLIYSHNVPQTLSFGFSPSTELNSNISTHIQVTLN